MFRYPSPPLFLLLAVPWTLGATTAEVDAPVGDRVAGERVAERCAACHTFEPEQRHTWGPPLIGVLGGPVGAEPDYRYGPYLRAQRDAGATWNEASLRAWLVDSKAVARAAGTRTKMPAQELTDDELDDLVSYLRTLR